METTKSLIQEVENGSDADEILNHLKAYNIDSIGPANRKGLTICTRDAGGKLLGGVIAYTHWDWLFISVLWVAENRRGQKIGSSLVAQAEEIAKRRGCKAVHLDTFSFQAPGFYEKLGYQKFGLIEDCPVKGSQRHFFRKTLQT